MKVAISFFALFLYSLSPTVRSEMSPGFVTNVAGLVIKHEHDGLIVSERREQGGVSSGRVETKISFEVVSWEKATIGVNCEREGAQIRVYNGGDEEVVLIVVSNMIKKILWSDRITFQSED
jgi:hypothetical protein